MRYETNDGLFGIKKIEDLFKKLQWEYDQLPDLYIDAELQHSFHWWNFCVTADAILEWAAFENGSGQDTRKKWKEEQMNKYPILMLFNILANESKHKKMGRREKLEKQTTTDMDQYGRPIMGGTAAVSEVIYSSTPSGQKSSLSFNYEEKPNTILVQVPGLVNGQPPALVDMKKAAELITGFWSQYVTQQSLPKDGKYQNADYFKSQNVDT